MLQSRKQPTLVYVAGPYSKPDPEDNVIAAIDVTNKLIDLGFTPYCPHLTHYINQRVYRPYEYWLAFDMHWLRLCDAVLRIPGESHGSDLEVAEAKARNIPVFYSIEELERGV